MVKTICSFETPRTYDAHEQMCKNLGMNVARVDSALVEKNVINFAVKQYGTRLPTNIFIEERLAEGRCQAVTNWYTKVANNYKIQYTFCAEAQHWGFCEFKQPRGV